MTDWLQRRYEDAKKAYDALMKFYPFTLEDLDGEQWADVPNCEGLYQISTFGRVKSFWGKTKIIRPQINAQGYLTVHIHKSGRKAWLVHRLVAICFIPNFSSKPEVNHNDGHRLNCHVSNLVWATRAENVKHASICNLIKKGEERYGAKLSNAEVLYIRENPNKLKPKELAEEFNVTIQKISAIQLGEYYASVGGVIRSCKLSNWKLPKEVRKAIREEFISGDRQFGMHALAKKYGVNTTMIWRIIHEK